MPRLDADVGETVDVDEVQRGPEHHEREYHDEAHLENLATRLAHLGVAHLNRLAWRFRFLQAQADFNVAEREYDEWYKVLNEEYKDVVELPPFDVVARPLFAALR